MDDFDKALEVKAKEVFDAHFEIGNSTAALDAEHSFSEGAYWSRDYCRDKYWLEGASDAAPFIKELEVKLKTATDALEKQTEAIDASKFSMGGIVAHYTAISFEALKQIKE